MIIENDGVIKMIDKTLYIDAFFQFIIIAVSLILLIVLIIILILLIKKIIK